MNWLMIRSMKISPAKPANVFVTPLITSSLDLIVPAPMPKPMPAARKMSVMRKIRLSMNGEVPMMSPVSGSRSGASGNAVSSTMTTAAASVA